VPDGIQASSIQIQFRPSVVEQMPSRISVFAFAGEPGHRLNNGQSGEWIHSIAADALLRRESPVAIIDLESPATRAFLVEFEGTTRAPIQRMALIGR
jgi:hypothetical protein